MQSEQTDAIAALIKIEKHNSGLESYWVGASNHESQQYSERSNPDQAVTTFGSKFSPEKPQSENLRVEEMLMQL